MTKEQKLKEDLDGYIWTAGIVDNQVRAAVVQIIMPLIKSTCHLKGEQELPTLPGARGIRFQGFLCGQDSLIKANFKPCREWE